MADEPVKLHLNSQSNHNLKYRQCTTSKDFKKHQKSDFKSESSRERDPQENPTSNYATTRASKRETSRKYRNTTVSGKRAERGLRKWESLARGRRGRVAWRVEEERTAAYGNITEQMRVWRQDVTLRGLWPPSPPLSLRPRVLSMACRRLGTRDSYRGQTRLMKMAWCTFNIVN